MKLLYKVLISTTVTLFYILTIELISSTLIRENNPYAWTADRNYRLDNELIYSRIPNSSWTWKTDEFEEVIQSNNLGFRDKDVLGKSENEYRIIAVGDSFTFGHGIEKNSETYPEKLEIYLNQNFKSKKQIEVINAAEKGYSPDQEYRLIKKRLLRLKPDMIIWNFSMPGDIYNLVHAAGWPIPALYDIGNNQLIELNARYNWLYISNSMRYNFPILNKSYIFNNLVKIAANIKLFSRKPYLSDKEMFTWALEKMVLEVEEIQKLALNNQFKLVVVLLPYPVALNEEFKQSKLATTIDSFKAELVKKGIRVVDIKKEIVKYSSVESNKIHLQDNVLGSQDISKEDLYYKKDYHPNRNGAELFAEIVGSKILSLF